MVFIMEFGNLFDGKYKIIRLLGAGGCGRVYLAENVRMKSLWAIKEIPCDGANLLQIDREIDVLMKIRHPALPRIVDVIREDGTIYLVEDYFEGRNVEDILKDKARVETATAIKWAYEICDIMVYLHSQEPEPIIYRDLKPSNIILTPSGAIRLVDFGSARRYKTDNLSDTVYIGTRGYAAPEQYGLGQTSKQSDVYSFGMTMLHILTGKRPIYIATGAAAKSPPNIDAYLESRIGGSGGGGGGGGGSGGDNAEEMRLYHVPDYLKSILSKCVEYEPSGRYQSFDVIKSELRFYTDFEQARDDAAGVAGAQSAAESGAGAGAGSGAKLGSGTGARSGSGTGTISGSGLGAGARSGSGSGSGSVLLKNEASRSGIHKCEAPAAWPLKNELPGPELSKNRVSIQGVSKNGVSGPGVSKNGVTVPDWPKNGAPGSGPRRDAASLFAAMRRRPPVPNEAGVKAGSGGGSAAGVITGSGSGDGRHNELDGIGSGISNGNGGGRPGGAAPEVFPRPTGVYRRPTISVTQNHEFAFEFAHRADEKFGLRALIIDLDFESTPTEWYFNASAAGKTGNGKNSLFRAVKVIERENTEENAIVGADGVLSAPRGRAERAAIAWFNETDPELTGVTAEKLSKNNGYMLRRFLAEVSVFADICLILTGNSVFGELNLLCYQNSHYILCPGRAEVPAIRAFGNTAALAENRYGIPSDRFKYVIWEHQYNDIDDEVMWEFAGESLAGVVRASRRREAARNGGLYSKCYAYSMERSIKKDYDDIMHALGIANNI